MIEALSGMLVDKVSMKGQKQRRMLKVHCGDFIRASGLSRARNAGQLLPKLELLWAKSPFRDFPHSSSVNLAEVTALGFGYSARAPALFPDVPPANCFSVYTPKRSFDFVCYEERHAEVFVLVLSRLCCRIQGQFWEQSPRAQSFFAPEAGARSRQLAAAGAPSVSTCLTV